MRHASAMREAALLIFAVLATRASAWSRSLAARGSSSRGRRIPAEADALRCRSAMRCCTRMQATKGPDDRTSASQQNEGGNAWQQTSRRDLIPVPPWRGIRQLVHIGPWGVKWDKRLQRYQKELSAAMGVDIDRRGSISINSSSARGRQGLNAKSPKSKVLYVSAPTPTPVPRPTSTTATRQLSADSETNEWSWNEVWNDGMPEVDFSVEAGARGVARVVFISDTHGKHECIQVPQCDILIHCGDVLQRYGYLGDYGAGQRGLKEFDEWLGQVPARHKFVIGGNHDTQMEADESTLASGLYSWRPNNGVLLDGSIVHDVCGLRLFGSPYSPPGVTSNRAFQRPEMWKHHEQNMVATSFSAHAGIGGDDGAVNENGEGGNNGASIQSASKYGDSYPFNSKSANKDGGIAGDHIRIRNRSHNHIRRRDQIDLLVTHARCGNIETMLMDPDSTICPRVWAHGHFHDQYGIDTLTSRDAACAVTRGDLPRSTLLVNAASCDMIYRPVNPPIVVDVPLVPR